MVFENVDLGSKSPAEAVKAERKRIADALSELVKDGTFDAELPLIQVIARLGGNLINVKRTATDGRHYTTFEAEYLIRPSREEIVQAQIEAGYHPAGYGGPHDIHYHLDNDNNGHMFVTWSCSGTCD